MPHHHTWHAEQEFAPGLLSARHARTFVADQLRTHRLDYLVEDATLVVSAEVGLVPSSQFAPAFALETLRRLVPGLTDVAVRMGERSLGVEASGDAAGNDRETVQERLRSTTRRLIHCAAAAKAGAAIDDPPMAASTLSAVLPSL